MATFDLSTWKKKQNDAADRELAYRAARIKEIEVILGLPLSGSNDAKRLANLQSQAAIRTRKDLEK
jgi:hypothetical protein